MIDIQIKGVTELIKTLEELKKQTAVKVEQLAMRLMSEGYYIADAGFARAQYAGTKDVEVWFPFWQGDTLILRAYGESVAFIEFGTGTFYEEYPEPAMRAKVGAVGRGQYDKKKGENPPWIYIGDAGELGEIKAYKKTGEPIVSTMGNPPARAMYDASKVLDKDHVMQIAREVFND